MDGKALREARRTKNWTQTDAAKALGVTQAYLSMIESGSRVLSKRLGRKALKVFDLPPTAWPLQLRSRMSSLPRKHDFGAELAGLGYPGLRIYGPECEETLPPSYSTLSMNRIWMPGLRKDCRGWP